MKQISNRNKLYILILFCIVFAAGVISFSQRGKIEEERIGGNEVSSVEEFAKLNPESKYLVTLDLLTLDPDGNNWPRAIITDQKNPGNIYHLPLYCNRIHMNSTEGICIRYTTKDKYITEVLLFNKNGDISSMGLFAGHPSRARMSRDGKYAALTNFVSGDSYNAIGFSTRTYLVDVKAKKFMDSLEDFQLIDQNGKVITPPDRNYWGVTFYRDSNNFLATVMYGDKKYLVKGDVAKRQMNVVAVDVECPSLSPDEKNIVYKKAKGAEWRLNLMDLNTMTSMELPETSNVDDQVEWLDNENILYSRLENEKEKLMLYKLQIYGAGGPEVFQTHSVSPSVLQSGDN